MADTVECHGRLPQAMEAAHAFIKRHADRGMVIAGVLDRVAGRIRELLTAGNTPQGLSTQQIAQGLRLTPRAVRARLARLVEQGNVVVVGTNERDPRRKYYWRT